MIRTHEIKLYPTPLQAAVFERWFVLCSRLYNVALEHRISSWKNGESVSVYTQQTQLTEIRKEFPEYGEMPTLVGRSPLHRLDKAYKSFFRRVKSGEKVGFPRFKSSRAWSSFELMRTGNYIKDGKFRVPKFGLIQCRGLREITGTQKGIRVIKRAGKWFANIIVDDGLATPKKKPITTSVGIDVGLNYYATFSDGQTIENPRFYRKAERQLKRAHRAISRKVKGSNNRRKAVLKLQRAYERVMNLRKNFTHQLSRKLIDSYDLIAVEALHIKNIVRNKRLSKSILDAAWSTFTNQLSYKAENAGSTVVMVDPAYTSQDCSSCGTRVPKSLSTREHCCTVCGLVLDRDHNAALNILARGRRVIACGVEVEVGPLCEAGSLSLN